MEPVLCQLYRHNFVPYAEQGLCNDTVSVRLSVRLSIRMFVAARAHSRKPAAGGLLLWARRAGDIHLFIHSFYFAPAISSHKQ